jgi:hypothetical protein
MDAWHQDRLADLHNFDFDFDFELRVAVENVRTFGAVSWVRDSRQPETI